MPRRTIATANEEHRKAVSPAAFPNRQDLSQPAKHSCPKGVSNAIRLLDRRLKAAYGGDFAYTIAGNGHLLGASNYVNGRIHPVVG